MSYSKINPHLFFLSGMYNDILVTDFLSRRLTSCYSNVIRSQNAIKPHSLIEINTNDYIDFGTDSGYTFFNRFGFNGNSVDYYVYKVKFPISEHVKDRKSFINNYRLFYTSQQYSNDMDTPFYGYINLCTTDFPDYESKDFVLLYDGMYAEEKYLVIRKDSITLGDNLILRYLYPFFKFTYEDTNGIVFEEADGQIFMRLPISKLPENAISLFATYEIELWSIKMSNSTDSFLLYCDHKSSYVDQSLSEEIVFKIIGDTSTLPTITRIDFWMMRGKELYLKYDTSPNYAMFYDIDKPLEAYTSNNITLFNPVLTADNNYAYTDNIVDLGIVSFNHFPFILDFTTLPMEDYLIEYITIPNRLTSTKLDNNILYLMTLLGDSYVDIIINSGMGIPSLENYSPLITNPDFNEYIDSGMDIRSYRLSKLAGVISTDPYSYKEYLDFIYDNEFYVREVPNCITYSEYRFNRTGSTLFSNIDLGEVHIYFKYRSEFGRANGIFFINGELITPSFVETNDGDTYFYIPLNRFNIAASDTDLDYFTTSTTDYSRTNDSYPEIPNLHGKIFLLAHNDTSNKETNILPIDSGSSSYNIFPSTTYFRICDLLIISRATGEIYDLNRFNFILKIPSYTYNDINSSKKLFINGVINPDAVQGVEIDIVNKLYTFNEEEYLTMDGLNILLGTENERISTSDILEEYPSLSIEDMSRKLQSSKYVQIASVDGSIIGDTLTIINDNTVNRYVIKDENVYGTAGGLSISCTINNYINKHTIDNLIVTVNGVDYTKFTNIQFSSIDYDCSVQLDINVPSEEFLPNTDIGTSIDLSSLSGVKIELIYIPSDIRREDYNISSITKPLASKVKDTITDYNTVDGVLDLSVNNDNFIDVYNKNSIVNNFKYPWSTLYGLSLLSSSIVSRGTIFNDSIDNSDIYRYSFMGRKLELDNNALDLQNIDLVKLKQDVDLILMLNGDVDNDTTIEVLNLTSPVDEVALFNK